MSRKDKRKELVSTDDAGSRESMRLQQLAQDVGVCSKRRKECMQETCFPKFLGSADGKDILKKSSSRKGRYLIHISAKFTPVVAGKLGTLANLDSKNPVLYFDFPSGRLRLTGTLIFPKNKYLLLKFGTKSALCEEVFDSIVCFSEINWVGQKEDNPSETPMPLPAELEQAIERDTSKSLQGGQTEKLLILAQEKAASRKRVSPLKSQQQQPSASARPSRAAADRIATHDTSSDEDDAEEDDEPPPSVPRDHLRRSSKTAAQRNLQENGSDAAPSDNASDVRYNDTDDDMPNPRRLRLSQDTAAVSAAKSTRKLAAKSKPAAASRRKKRTHEGSSESGAGDEPEVLSISSGSEDGGANANELDDASSSDDGTADDDDDFEP